MACYTNNSIFFYIHFNKTFSKDLNTVSLKSKEAKADEEVKSCTLKIGLTKLL